MAGAALAVLSMFIDAGDTGSAPARDRTISLYNIHTKETVTVLYKKDGRYVPDALEKVNWALRDWRKDEPTKMDPELIDLLWEMHTELGSREPIHIISGYRSRSTNEMLRASVGGQASESRHILGKAADVHFPDVPLKTLRYSALVRERGGVGYYPTSAIPFVHVDTDRVRHWPRLPRHELALLFPTGRTQHQPADGGPISSDDVRTAQAKYQDVAVQVAAFHTQRKNGGTQTQIASATPPVPATTPTLVSAPRKMQEQRVASLAPPEPRLIEAPRIVDRPQRLIQRPTDDDRARLTELISLASFSPPKPAERPRAIGTAPAKVAAIAPNVTEAARSLSDTPPPTLGGNFVQAPAFDEEHPDELAYRPFPIAPMLTLTASIDDPALARLHHPDAQRTLEMLDSTGSAPPMRLRPGQQVAASLWAQQFKGEAINPSTRMDEPTTDQGLRSSARKVSTSMR
jgi:uncharacterized protein YcbK (DUF882 family)